MLLRCPAPPPSIDGGGGGGVGWGGGGGALLVLHLIENYFYIPHFYITMIRFTSCIN